MAGRVVLGISGGIAAFKSVELLRELIRHDVEVRVIMTPHASEFVHPRTFAVLSGFPVEVDQWAHPVEAGVDHVDLSHWADLLVIAPATANILAKLAAGIADNALTTYALAHRRRVLVAPAMNTVMWRQPATVAAMASLVERGVAVVDPEPGVLACGDEGEGRLAAVRAILDRALRLLPPRGPLAGLRVLVSAGPTREAIDIVRVLTNRSSGRMGVALAAEARRLGAETVLVHGPLSVEPPAGVEAVAVESAVEMGDALDRLAPSVDAALLTAAVADLRPARPVAGKLDRRAGPLQLELEAVPDLAAGLGARPDRPYLVVFSAEAGADRDRAVAKMRAKGADAVVLNDISAPGIGMESARNEVWLMSVTGLDHHVATAGKEEVAREILLALSGELLAARAKRCAPAT